MKQQGERVDMVAESKLVAELIGSERDELDINPNTDIGKKRTPSSGPAWQKPSVKSAIQIEPAADADQLAPGRENKFSGVLIIHFRTTHSQ